MVCICWICEDDIEYDAEESVPREGKDLKLRLPDAILLAYLPILNLELAAKASSFEKVEDCS